MGLLRRNKNAAPAAGTEVQPQAAAEVAAESVMDAGPYDSSEITDGSSYLKLGSIWLRGVDGMELRLEVNEAEGSITGVTAVLADSAVQLQAFAAPRTEGVWVEIRNEIAASIVDAGGTAEVITGVFGEELITRMPQSGPDGRTVFVPARFVGVDGPRWFLRAVVSGRAVVDAAAAAPMNAVIGSVVIDRGAEAMTQRELLPLSLPAEPQTAPDPNAADGDGDGDGEDGPAATPAAHLDDLKPFERGPEITEVR